MSGNAPPGEGLKGILGVRAVEQLDARALLALHRGAQQIAEAVVEHGLGTGDGGALEFAASCDLRIATDRARFGTPEVGIGLTYTNAGSHFLPSTMGETAARELLLTGALRDVAWAERHRFVNEVVPAADLEARIAAWAAGFDDVSRAAVARTKAMLNDRFGDLLGAAMEREERACIELFDGPDAPAALAAFAQRRR